MSARLNAGLAFACVCALGFFAVAQPALGRGAFGAWLWFATVYFAVTIPILIAAPLAVRFARAVRPRDD